MSSATTQLFDVDSTVMGKVVPVSVVLPPGFQRSGESMPLCVSLHGGGGDRTDIVNNRPLYERMWADGSLAPMVIAAPSTGPRSWYVDPWEDFIADELPLRMAERFNTRDDPAGTLLTGVSMGGFGTLKIGLRRPERFAALAALEPAIEPGFTRAAATPRNMFYRFPEEDAALWGDPIDEERWQRDNPANVARSNAESIRASGVEIYLEAGDEDGLNLHDGTEFLHRVLWDLDIRHEYHLVRWGNHVGPSLEGRVAEAYRFLTHVLAGGLSTPGAIELNADERAFVEWARGGMVGERRDLSVVAPERVPAVLEAIMADRRESARSMDPSVARAYGPMPTTG